MPEPVAFAVLPAGYLLGAIPVGLIAGRVAGVDIRQQGSGRTGATNALRALGPALAGIVLLADVLKGVAAAALGELVQPGSGGWLAAGAGLAAVLGHNWSVFIGFGGGRGVATSVGAMVVLAPLTVAILLPVAAIVIGLTRFVSLASVIAAALAPLVTVGLAWQGIARWPAVGLAVGAALLVLVAHRDNIGRLLAGTERRLGDRAEVGR